MLKLTEYQRTGKEHQAEFRLYVNGKESGLPPLLPLLPTRKDKTFEGYHHRLTSKTNDIKYGLIINYLQTVDPQLFESVCRQLQPFLREIGIPFGNRSCTLWLGNYERTPFGVHIDPLAGFQFPIIGRKRLRLWTSEYQNKHPELELAQDYKKHLRNSVLIEADPGGMLYWPSDLWHVGESDGQFHVSLGIPFYFGELIARKSLQVTLKKWENETEKSEYCLRNGSFPLKSRSLESNTDDYVGNIERRYRQIVSEFDSPDTLLALRERSLRSLSAYGFEIVPPASKQVPVNMDDVIRIDSLFPYVCLPYPDCDTNFVVSCKGHSLRVKETPMLPKLLNTLNQGQGLLVRDLVKRKPQTWEPS